MLILTTNHKVNDIVYVVDDCVRRGVVRQVNFAQQNDEDVPFTLSYDIAYDGFSFNTTVTSAVDFAVPGAGSPLQIGSPQVGSPLANINGSPLPDSIVIEEETNGGGIYKVKGAALNAFGDTLA